VLAEIYEGELLITEAIQSSWDYSFSLSLVEGPPLIASLLFYLKRAILMQFVTINIVTVFTIYSSSKGANVGRSGQGHNEDSQHCCHNY
jgi:hypothetical protein